MLKVSFSPLVANQFHSNCNAVVLLQSKSFLTFIPERFFCRNLCMGGYFPVSKSKLSSPLLEAWPFLNKSSRMVVWKHIFLLGSQEVTYEAENTFNNVLKAGMF